MLGLYGVSRVVGLVRDLVRGIEGTMLGSSVGQRECGMNARRLSGIIHKTYLIFVIFSTGTIFGSNFLHTIVRTKQCKMQQNAINCTYNVIINEGDFRFLHICHVQKFETTPHGEKFQISPHLSCTEIKKFST